MKSTFYLLFSVLFFSFNTFAQERVISGTVTDQTDKAPLPGVSVRIKGTQIGTQTGPDGKYTLRIPSGNNTLTFTYIGYATRDIAIGANNTLNVSLVASARELGEVVVTALGISRAKKALGYSATTVDAEEVNRAAPINVVQGLQGKVAGADISITSGTPGGSSKVVLRGFSSIAGSNQPLYVVDGVPISNARIGQAAPIGSIGDLEDNFDFGNLANDINPNDIESVNVLKGAAATSLYGSRGANGVIIITTKRGKAGNLRVDFSSSASFTQVSVVPQLQKKFGQGWDNTFILSENGSWGPRLDGQLRPWGAIVNNTQLLKPFSFVKDNFRDAFDTGAELNNTLSLSGGTESSTYFLSYGNINSDGMMPSDNDTYKRNTVSLSGSTKFKGFSASTTINYVGRKSRFVETGQGLSGIGANFYEEILQIPVDIPIQEFEDYKNLYFNVDNYFTPFAENPYYPLYENGSRFNSDRVYGNLDLKYQAAKWLSFQFQQGADVTNGVNRIWHAKNAPSPGSWNDGANVEGAQRQADVGNVVEGSEKYFEYDSKLHALFDADLTDKFDITGLIGLNYNDRGYRTLYSSVEDLVIPGFYNLNNSVNSPVSVETQTHRRLIGAYASATLGYRNFAYLTLSARNDWSSTLPQGENSYFYPSANLSVIVSDALDLSKAKISLLKLRASWGQTGNDTDPYRIFNTLRSANIPVRTTGTVITFPVNNVAGFSIANTLNNSNLKPEISQETEFGGELRFFNNRLGFDLAYYNKTTRDQILPVNTAPSSGYNFLIVNFGKVRNKGIELAFNAVPVKTRDFNWELNYTFARNRNEVLELPNGLEQVVINDAYDAQLIARVGEPLAVIEAPVPKTDPEGRIIVNPSNGLAVPAIANVKYGSTQRDFSMGLTNGLTYKGLNLAFTWDWKKGGVFYSGTADLLGFTGNDVRTTYNDRKPFIIPNSVLEVTDAAGNVSYVENNIPIAETEIDDYYYHSSNKALAYYNRIIDKSFIKLRDVTLTYALPKSVASKIRAQRASLAVFGRNLWTWLPEQNRSIDPEVSNFGNDLRSEFGEFRTGPSTRNFGASLRVSF